MYHGKRKQRKRCTSIKTLDVRGGAAGGTERNGTQMSMEEGLVQIAILSQDKKLSDALAASSGAYCSAFGMPCRCSVYPGAESFAAALQPEMYAVVFTDCTGGEESLALLRKAAPHAGIILVSKEPANAMLGYAVEASGFLSLPLGDEAFSQAFARAYRRAQEEDDGSILIKEKSGYRRVYARDVRFVQVSGHRLIFHLFDGTITTRGQLCGAEERLEKAGFFRCSANYMVNLRYVEWPNRGRVRVGSSEIPVSRQKKGDLYGRLCGRARRKVPHCGEVYIL